LRGNVLYFAMLRHQSERIDRTMRTFTARRTAESAHDLVAEAMHRASGASAAAQQEAILETLAARVAWTRTGPRELVCTFGRRSATLNVPSPFDPQQFAALIARVEVNVYLGDSSDELLRELQSLAQRELHLLFAEA
jgi:hypothetical protein